MTAPQRIQLRRTKGWKMPPHTVKVDRSTVWGNPWTIAKAREFGFEGCDDDLRAMTVSMFRNAMEQRLPAVGTILARLPELRGKNLACWCKPGQTCHADVLLEMANAQEAT